MQQLRESFSGADLYRYMILNRDSKFNADVIAMLEATGFTPKRTSVQAPWQNGTAERWIGSCRREPLDHVIALNEQYLRRLIREYVKTTKIGCTTLLMRTRRTDGLWKASRHQL